MLKNIPITELKPYPNNPRKNDHAVDAVAASIREFGFKVPLVIDKDGVIVAGHTRYKAAQKLGLKELPCIVADDLTDDQIKAFRLADNKTAELAEWDFDLLNIELDDIDLDMEQFGFEKADEADITAVLEGDERVSLADRYLVPPFSVIYGNRVDWLDRKRNWVAFGIHSELGRGGQLVYQFPAWMERQAQTITKGARNSE